MCTAIPLTVIKRIVEYFGYTFDTSFFDNNFLRNVYVCSAVSSNRVAAALPHWTVSEFFDELEKFLCAVTVVNERTKVVSLVGLNDYLQNPERRLFLHPPCYGSSLWILKMKE